MYANSYSQKTDSAIYLQYTCNRKTVIFNDLNLNSILVMNIKNR